MATFTLCMVTLTVLLAAATITSITVEIVNLAESRGRCRQKIERQRQSSYQRYLEDSSRFDLRPGNEGSQWREEFPRCCEELEQIDEQCRCEAVKQMVQEQRQVGGLQGREMREMWRTAESLPCLCRISPQYCDNVRGDPMF